jgi:hypothetical protein
MPSNNQSMRIGCCVVDRCRDRFLSGHVKYGDLCRAAK